MLFFHAIILMHSWFQVRDLQRRPPLSPVARFLLALIIGYPIVNVPLGTLSKNGLPFGLSFMGTVLPSLFLLMIEI